MASHGDGTRTPATSKGAATRERIVAAAARLVYAQGVGRTSMDDVGSAASAGRSQMYHYFSGKADLVAAVIDHQAVLGIDIGDLADWDGWSRWRDAVVANQIDYDCAGGCPLGSLASELTGLDERAQSAISRHFVAWEQMFRSAIESMRTRGLISVDADSSALAIGVVTALEGGLLLSKAHRDPAYLAAALDGAIERMKAPAG